jgi:DNA polymerase-1
MWGANTDHKFLRLPNEVIYRYNAYDAFATAHLAQALDKELADPKVGNHEFYARWVRPLMRSVVDMQRRGILVDKGKRTEFRKKLTSELTEVDTQILSHADSVGFKYNDKFLNSGQQLGKFLFGACELKVAGKTPTGQPQVDQINLLRVLRDLRKKDEPHREVVLNLLHRSRLQTVFERYIGFETSSDSRLRARVKMCGTKTFRFAYADPALQQFPNEVRGFFVAKPGHLLLAIDYSQIEARILAILSGDEISLEVFKEGGDVHQRNALDLLGYSEDQWGSFSSVAKKGARNRAKSFLYEISYGGEGLKNEGKAPCPCLRCAHLVAPSLKLTPDETRAATERWFEKHHWVRQWQRNLIAEVYKRHYYQSPFGVRRWISSPRSNELEREVKNIPCQMNAALRMIQAQVELGDAPILMQYHDAFLFEIPESPGSSVDQRIADYSGIMQSPVPELGGAVFPTKPSLGKNWSDYSPANPDGLREL